MYVPEESSSKYDDANYVIEKYNQLFHPKLPLYKYVSTWSTFIHNVKSSGAYKHYMNHPSELSMSTFKYVFELLEHTVIYQNGRVIWMRNGQIHRSFDDPAVISEGRVEYYKNGKRHRIHGKPAVIDDIGIMEYYFDGKLSRVPGLPAKLSATEGIVYSVRGKIERPGDLPSVISESRTVFYEDGKVSRDPKKGPAFYNIDLSSAEYIQDGKHCTDKSILRLLEDDDLTFDSDAKRQKTDSD